MKMSGPHIKRIIEEEVVAACRMSFPWLWITDKKGTHNYYNYVQLERQEGPILLLQEHKEYQSLCRRWTHNMWFFLVFLRAFEVPTSFIRSEIVKMGTWFPEKTMFSKGSVGLQPSRTEMRFFGILMLNLTRAQVEFADLKLELNSFRICWARTRVKLANLKQELGSFSIIN